MAFQIWSLIAKLGAHSRWMQRVERSAADCLAIIWPHVSPVARTMSQNELHGYLQAHATLHVTRHVIDEDIRFYDAVVQCVVQMLQQRVIQLQPSAVLRRAA